MLVHARVQIVEPFAELELLPVDRDGPQRRLHPGLRREGQICDARGEEPLDARALELDEARHAPGFALMEPASDDLAEEPNQEIEKVDPDVRDEAAGPLLGSLP